MPFIEALYFLLPRIPPKSEEKGQILAASLHILVVFDLGLQGAWPGFRTRTFERMDGYGRVLMVFREIDSPN